MKVRHDEGVANRIGPEPCDAIREGCVEASVGERIGQPWSRERLKVSGADVVRNTEGDMDGRVSASGRPARRGWAFSGQVVRFIGTSKNSGCCFGIQGLSPIS